MSKLEFDMKGIDKIPDRRYKKGSKYDPVIDAFLKSKDKVAVVTIKDRKSSYIVLQLKKRIVARELSMKASVSNNGVYLEK